MPAVASVRAGIVIVEAAPDELDEDVLERRLGLAQREDVGAQAAERPDDAAQRAVLFEHEVEADGLALDAVVHLGGRGRGHDPWQPGERIRAAVEAVELQAEDRLALDAELEFLRGADGQDPAVVDDGDPLAELVGLGHVVGRQQDGPTGDGSLPGGDQLPDRSRGCDVEAERRLVEE
jgi:hypothetical protein